MCGIAVIAGTGFHRGSLEAMIDSLHHRGPDGKGLFQDSKAHVGLAHSRLSIIDLSQAGQQPMHCHRGRLSIVFNGEIYNYVELRQELSGYVFHSHTDTEVLLAAYERWGIGCLDRLIGMFSFAIWDNQSRELVIVRDRFGVKPMYYSVQPDGTLYAASEIKAIHAAGIEADPDEQTWSTFLGHGLYDHCDSTFWKNVRSLPPGHYLTWKDRRIEIRCWYDLIEAVGETLDSRSAADVSEEYWSLLNDSVCKRFRADVPVGINLSGGLDSSILLGMVQSVQGPESDVKAYTFVTGDERYDELPWVNQMLNQTRHPSIVCRLDASDVPNLAESVQESQDEPFGGLPTLAYARIFEQARRDGVYVLLDGQGMDEQWAGYEYYAKALENQELRVDTNGPVQGSRQPTTRPECLTPEFRKQARKFVPPKPFRDALRNYQYRDTRYAKIPRALRFNDRISMRSSVELREPFMDHRLFELAFRQSSDRKISDGTGKWLLRQIAKEFLPTRVVDAPKRPLQTPQREWLREDLYEWATDTIEKGLTAYGDRWLNVEAIRREMRGYKSGECDSSFHIWQWISVGLCAKIAEQRASSVAVANVNKSDKVSLVQ